MRPAAIASRKPGAVVARGLRPDLQHLAESVHGVAQLDRLLDGVRHRLLDVHVLARGHGVDGDLRVPMVRRGDQHGVDVVAIQEVPIIERAVGAADPFCPVQPPLVNIAHRGDLHVIVVGPLHQLSEMAGAHSAAADDAKADAIVRAERRRARQAWNHERPAGDSRCDLEEAAARNKRVAHRTIPVGEGSAGRAKRATPILSCAESGL